MKVNDAALPGYQDKRMGILTTEDAEEHGVLCYQFYARKGNEFNGSCLGTVF
jgi:hypothetical protein